VNSTRILVEPMKLQSTYSADFCEQVIYGIDSSCQKNKNIYEIVLTIIANVRQMLEYRSLSKICPPLKIAVTAFASPSQYSHHSITGCV